MGRGGQKVLNENDAVSLFQVDSTSDNDSHYSGGFGGRLAQPTSKPRKYRIKPDSEKVNPQYKMKRAKNNDAVRRSREKAKHVSPIKLNPTLLSIVSGSIREGEASQLFGI